MKKQTALMVAIDNWNRMPSHIFQQYMTENYASLLIKGRQEIENAYAQGRMDESGFSSSHDAKKYYENAYETK